MLDVDHDIGARCRVGFLARRRMPPAPNVAKGHVALRLSVDNGQGFELHVDDVDDAKKGALDELAKLGRLAVLVLTGGPVFFDAKINPALHQSLLLSRIKEAPS